MTPDHNPLRPRVSLQTALGVAGLVAAFVLLTQIAMRRPLWYDELFSYYVACLPSPAAILQALLQGADNGPPLDYWLRHFSIRLFGQSGLALRLPSLLATAITALCLFAFLRRRLSVRASYVGAAIPFGSLAARYAVEGRGYATLLAVNAIALLLWQRGAAPVGGRSRRVALCLVLACAPLVHYLGVLVVVPILAGEAWMYWQARRPSPTLPFVLASQISLFLLPSFARHALSMRGAFWASDYSLRTPVATYPVLLGWLFWPLLGLIAYLAIDAARSTRAPKPLPSRLGLESRELVAAIASAATPFVVLLMAAFVTHAMTYRYSLPAVLGVSILAAQGLQRLKSQSKLFAATLAVGLLLLAAGSLLQRWQREPRSADPAPVQILLEQLNEPVIFDSPRRYLESYSRIRSPFRPLCLYLYDREASRRQLGHDNDEIALVNLRQIQPLNLHAYREYCDANPSFYLVVDSSPGWLLAQLRDDAFQIQHLRDYADVALYRVSRDSIGPRGLD